MSSLHLIHGLGLLYFYVLPWPSHEQFLVHGGANNYTNGCNCGYISHLPHCIILLC